MKIMLCMLVYDHECWCDAGSNPTEALPILESSSWHHYHIAPVKSTVV